MNVRDREFQTTLKVLQAYPEDKMNMKPAEKSRTAAELAMIMAVEEHVITSLIHTGATNLELLNPKLPASMKAIIAEWQQAVSENNALLAKLASEKFEKPVHFYSMNIPFAQALWIELFDHIHHRGQFSVYLRLAGAKVPSIYGPTADEPRRHVGSNAGN